LGISARGLNRPGLRRESIQPPASGQHFADVKLRVQNKASGTDQNNASNETTIVLSGGETLHADYNPIADRGNFGNGQIRLKVAQPAPDA
jgi:hypothetical protein